MIRTPALFAIAMLACGGAVSAAQRGSSQNQPQGAADPQRVFDDAKALANSKNADVGAGLSNGSAYKTVPNYTGSTSLPGASAYSKDPNGAPAQLKVLCAQSPNDPTCAAINSGSASRPVTYIPLNSPALAGRTAVTNPQAILGDFSTTYNACTTTTPTLQSAATFKNLTCKLNLTQNVCDTKLTVVPKDIYNCTPGTWYYNETIPRVVNGNIDQMHISVLCQPINGAGQLVFQVYAHGSDGACAGWQQESHVMNAATGESWVAHLAPDWDDGCHDMNVYQSGPGCSNGTCSTTFRFDWPGREGYTRTINFAEPRIVQLAGQSWNDGCTSFEQQVQDPQTTAGTSSSLTFGKPVCSMTSKVCVDGPSTKLIDGVSVTRDCWDYQSMYACSAGDPGTASTCSKDTLINCKQSGPAVCTGSGSGSSCTQQSVPYQCPLGNATYNQAVNCGPSSFCSGGSCYDSANQPSQPQTQFVSSISQLAGAFQAAAELNTADLTVFNGKALHCKKTILGAVDCCDSSTILDQVGGGGPLLLACKSEQQMVVELAQDRQDGKCHYNWEWVSKHGPLGIKIETTKSFCCFNSKLARIINEQGRGQIGKSWGSDSNPDNPDCTGFTVAQLQSLDFSVMDFSEFYGDIKPTIPSSGSQVNQVNTTAPNCYYGSGNCQ